MVRLLPKDVKFFEMFAEMSSNLNRGAALLRLILDDFDNLDDRVQQLKDIEHRGDELTHAILVKLNKTFITPFDREDIHRLASSLDDVLDFLYSAGERILLYKIQAAPPAAIELADVIIAQCAELASAVSGLERQEGVLERCVEINRLENVADGIGRKAIGQLFQTETDPIALIKLKELYETLESATDKAEDAANVLEAVILKST